MLGYDVFTKTKRSFSIQFNKTLVCISLRLNFETIVRNILVGSITHNFVRSDNHLFRIYVIDPITFKYVVLIVLSTTTTKTM